MTLVSEIKDICNKIVAKWYSIDINLSLEFEFLFDIRGEALVYLKDGNSAPCKKIYGIGTQPSLDSEGNFQFYLDIHNLPEKLYYQILYVDRDTMILKYMQPFGTSIGSEIIFKRITESSNNILENL